MECTVINNLLAGIIKYWNINAHSDQNILNADLSVFQDLSTILGTTENYEMNIGTEWSTLYYMNVFSK